MKINEIKIVNTIFNHPYLINEECCQATKQKELYLGCAGRADIVFTLTNCTYVIEIKRLTLSTKDVNQLIAYIDHLRTNNNIKEIRGVIVGKKPYNDKKLYTLTNYVKEKAAYSINLLYIDIDIPMLNKQCSNLNWKRISHVEAYRCSYC
ncbi:protein belonging to Uncharacterized protein family UPF0286, partial [Candidatus Magnetobacterium bavaricum]